MKIKPIVKGITIAQSLLHIVMNISVVLLYAGCILVFVSANVEYFQELPQVILLGIPLGLIAILTKILTINWWGFHLSSDELIKLNKHYTADAKSVPDHSQEKADNPAPSPDTSQQIKSEIDKDYAKPKQGETK